MCVQMPALFIRKAGTLVCQFKPQVKTHVIGARHYNGLLPFVVPQASCHHQREKCSTAPHTRHRRKACMRASAHLIMRDAQAQAALFARMVGEWQELEIPADIDLSGKRVAVIDDGISSGGSILVRHITPQPSTSAAIACGCTAVACSMAAHAGSCMQVDRNRKFYFRQIALSNHSLRAMHCTSPWGWRKCCFCGSAGVLRFGLTGRRW